MYKLHSFLLLFIIHCMVLITQVGNVECRTVADHSKDMRHKAHTTVIGKNKAMPWIAFLLLSRAEGLPVFRGWVGPQGGRVSDPNGATISIPPGALSNNTLISVQTHHNTVFLPSPAPFAGGAKFGPLGLIFNLPATITFPLTKALPAGSELSLFVYDDIHNSWLLTDFMARVNNDGRSASAAITHFSEMITFGPPHYDLNMIQLQERFIDICSPTLTSNLFDDFVSNVSNTFIIGQKKLWDFSGYAPRRCHACYETVGLSFSWKVSRAIPDPNYLPDPNLPPSDGEGWINIEDSNYERNLNEAEWYDPASGRAKPGVFSMSFRDFVDVRVSNINCGGDFQLNYEVNMVVWLRCCSPSLMLETTVTELELEEHATVHASLLCGIEGMEGETIDFTVTGDGEINTTQIITNANGAGEIDLQALNQDCSGSAVVRAEYRACVGQGLMGQAIAVAETTIDISSDALSGTWNITEVADERACDEGINTYTGVGSLTQTDNAVDFVWPGGYFLGAKSNCNIIGLGGESEDGGTTYGGGTLTISEDGDTIHGSGNWTWEGIDPVTGLPSSCLGTSIITLTR